MCETYLSSLKTVKTGTINPLKNFILVVECFGCFVEIATNMLELSETQCDSVTLQPAVFILVDSPQTANSKFDKRIPISNLLHGQTLNSMRFDFFCHPQSDCVPKTREKNLRLRHKVKKCNLMQNNYFIFFATGSGHRQRI